MYLNYYLPLYLVILVTITACNKSDDVNDANQYEVEVDFQQTNLPIITINTFGVNIPDEPRIDAQMGIINNPDGENTITDSFNDYDGKITIEKRGNSSQDQEKPPYRFETVTDDGNNNNVQLLGLPEENDWVLYAPWSDKSLIRNVLIYELSNDMGRYAPRTRFIELYINEAYKGVYVLMEKIKRDKNRVAISALEPGDQSGDAVTGGYILKFDWGDTGDNNGGFNSLVDGMLYNYHYPKPSVISSAQEAYIQNVINDFETVMNSNAFNSEVGYPKFLDVDAFIDFIILQEISRNVDAYGLSTFFYKDKTSINDKLVAGPIWDFNHGFGNCDYFDAWQTEGWNISYTNEEMDQRAFWWLKLWSDENFRLKLKNRFNTLRGTILSNNAIYAKIDTYVTNLGDAVSRNFTKWPILGTYIWPNYEVFSTYDAEVTYLKSWIDKRLNWMDKALN